MIDFKLLAQEKTKLWIIGTTQFRNGNKFVFTFGGLTPDGEIIGLTSHSTPRKELIKIYSLKEVSEWAISDEVRIERRNLALKNILKEKVSKIL